ncbi:MAG TPA: MFS transporter [Burkholderiales bacterium]|nr:MFS transporter [Burkholderiales bacterium]
MSREASDAAQLQRTALAVLASCFLLNMLGRGIGDTYSVFLKPLEAEFGWSRSSLTSVYSLYLLVNGFAAPFVGMAFDRLGPRWAYSTGLVVLGGAFLLAGSLDRLWQFYLLVGVSVGIGVSFTGMVPSSGLLSRWFRARLSTALGVAYSGFGVGSVVFVPLAQVLINRIEWENAYRVLGSILLLAALCVAFGLPWKRFRAGHPSYRLDAQRGEGGGGWTLRGALKSRMYWALAQAFFCTSVAMFIILVQLVVFLIDAGFAPLTAATAVGFVGMLSAMSVMGSGFLSDRFGVRQTVTASFAGTATGMLLLIALAGSASMILLVAFVLVFGLCMGVRGPIISSVSAKHFAGPRVATIYGTIYATNALGAACGSLLGGVLHDLTDGYRVGFLCSLGFILLAAAPFWTVKALRNFR